MTGKYTEKHTQFLKKLDLQPGEVIQKETRANVRNSIHQSEILS